MDEPGEHSRRVGAAAESEDHDPVTLASLAVFDVLIGEAQTLLDAISMGSMEVPPA
jgi:hypothetical protein